MKFRPLAALAAIAASAAVIYAAVLTFSGFMTWAATLSSQEKPFFYIGCLMLLGLFGIAAVLRFVLRRRQ